MTGPAGNFRFVGPMTMKTQVRRIRLADAKPETLTEPGFVHDVAFLSGWAPRVVGRNDGDQRNARHEPT